MIPIEIRYQLKVFEVKNTWYTKVTEHIAYELRYWKIKFNRAWLNIHESTLLYLITLVELLIHIESEQHSLRVLTPKETTKDKFVNMLVSKITNHRMGFPLNVCI